MVKKRSYDGEGEDPQGQQSAIRTLYYCLEAVLKLFAPFVPHITEELYSHIFEEKYAEQGSSIHTPGCWPDANSYPVSEKEEAAGVATVSLLDAIRKLKAEKNVSIKWPLTEVVIASDKKPEAIDGCIEDFKNVTNSAEVKWADSGKDGIETDCGLFSISADFADESDAA